MEKKGTGEFPGEFPAQMASNAENVSVWWRHHAYRTPHRHDIQTTQNPQHPPVDM